MGLIKCNYCGKEISDRVTECPFCRNNVIKDKNNNLYKKCYFKCVSDGFLINEFGGITVRLFLDTETGVQYWCNSSGAICPRYNADGTLYIDKEYK